MNATSTMSRFSISARDESMPDLQWENQCWEDGYRVVAGVDEAGRGALAGPIVAAAVVFPRNMVLTADLGLIDDSKVLSAKRREMLARLIRASAQSWAVGSVEACAIDEIGIARANRLAMELAIAGLRKSPTFVLLDAITCEGSWPQAGLIDGDAISLSIAAASILAKTERDRIMHAAHFTYARYGFLRHVGYGTEIHLAALRDHGPCDLHRRTFRGVLPGIEE
jgi:ribonuclease HII